ncbi:putative disease resistance protein [Senna tora]|uniref:Putative disease resistance protein n=1 Tax=Senna tora TaxID=362788 RepID=A0A834W3U3_9FABA|nr:putative disease resistance protein [Senna tora]
MEALKEPDVKMVGLCGLGGVGKTTIAKEVEKKVMEEEMFETVVMVTVTDHPNLEKIQGEIAEMMGMELDEKYINTRASRLHVRLKQEKNMLLIFDDLWEKLDLWQIGVPFDDDDNKNEQHCKIFLTSRNERVLSDQMRCKRNVKVGALCDDEAWALFKRIAELPDDINLLSVAEKIVERCGGLPVRIVAAVGALRNKALSEWKDALHQLENPLRRNITGINEADSVLRLSYDKLSQDVQPIFLLSAMLSYDPMILDLLMYSVGLNLLQGVDTMEKARDGIQVIVSKLKASNLLDSSSSDHFSMHDVVRDVALSIASNEKHSLVVRHGKFKSPDKNVLEGYTKILLDKSDINDLPPELYCPRLELLLLNKIFGKENSSSSSLQEESPYVKYPLFFPEKVNPNLKMLSLDGKRLAAMLMNDQLGFATTFFSLEELRVNGSACFKKIFSKPFRDDCFQLDFILPNLESLLVISCDNLIKLGPSFISFKNLVVIIVDCCYRLTSLLTSSIATSLVQLTKLTLNSCVKIEEIISKEGDDQMEKEIILFKKLRSLELEVLPSLKSFCSLNYSFMFPSLDKVAIRGCCNLRMFCPGDIYAPLLKGVEMELGEETEELWESNLNKTIQLVFLQEVTYLELSPEMKNVWVEKLAHPKPFSKLESLTVDNCDFLCEYVIPTHLVKSLSNLKWLMVQNCHSIKTIFDVKGMELDEEAHTSLPNIGLTQLHTLEIESCKVLEVIVAEDETSSEESPRFEFPQLEGLTLSQKDATMLRDGEFQADLLDKVNTLRLESFLDESLTFSYSFLERFPNLQQLRVEHSCFEEILPSQEQIVNQRGKIAPFKELYVGYLDQLKTIWNNDSQLQPIHQDLESLEVERCGSLIKLTPPLASFENLTLLIVSGCHQLIYLVTSSTAKSLVNLDFLWISDCERMEEIVRNESEEVEATITFNKLSSLDLTGLTSLKSFCSQNHTFEFPELEGVTITECHQMKMFCPGVVETPELCKVELDEDESSLEGDLNKTIKFLLLNRDGTNMYKED